MGSAYTELTEGYTLKAPCLRPISTGTVHFVRLWGEMPPSCHSPEPLHTNARWFPPQALQAPGSYTEIDGIRKAHPVSFRVGSFSEGLRVISFGLNERTHLSFGHLPAFADVRRVGVVHLSRPIFSSQPCQF